MKFKKICSALLVGAVMSTACAFAEEPQQVIEESQQEVIEEPIVPVNVPVVRSSMTHMNYDYKGSNFDEDFKCVNGAGNKMNINIKNNGSQSIKYKISRGKSNFASGTLRAGRSYTVPCFSPSGPVSGTWTVLVYTDDDSKMDISVKARQYDGN